MKYFDIRVAIIGNPAGQHINFTVEAASKQEAREIFYRWRVINLKAFEHCLAAVCNADITETTIIRAEDLPEES